MQILKCLILLGFISCANIIEPEESNKMSIDDELLEMVINDALYDSDIDHSLLEIIDISSDIDDLFENMNHD